MSHKPGYHRRLHAEGGKRPYIDGGFVAGHIRRLMDAGMSRRQIERAAGVDYKTVRSALEGRRLQQSSAKAILAVRPRIDSEWVYIPAGPTLAIINRLWRQGFSKGWIAQSAGLAACPKPGQRKVRAYVASAIRELDEFYANQEGFCRDGRRLGGRDNGRRLACPDHAGA